ncbi:MAG: glycine zipper 2TM domain-containing protein [Deltaproteobacteria bacterium]
MMIYSRKTECFASIQRCWMSGFGQRLLLFLTVFILAGLYPATIHAQQRFTSESNGQNGGSAITQVYFYPQLGQTTKQQSRDHYECYNWATDQTGFDQSVSSIPSEQRVRVVPMPPPGHDTVVMSIAGAVLGALIAGPRHAGQGALIGAAGGAFAGAVSDISRQESARQMEEAYANSHQARDLHCERRSLDFRRAMSACLEGRGYSVQY